MLALPSLPAHPESRAPDRPQTRAWFLFGASLLAAKLVFLALDHTAQYYQGDSNTYLWTAVTGYIPPERSFVYGFLIRLVALATRRLFLLVLLQTLLGTAGAYLLARVLTRRFEAPRALAFAAAFLFAADAYQMMYERYVLTEAVSTFVLAVYLAGALTYLSEPSLRRIVAVNALGVLLISLRMSLLSFTWVTALGLPLFALFGRGRASTPGSGLSGERRTARALVRSPLVRHLALSLSVTFVLHFGYKALNGVLSRSPPAYMYGDGPFLISAWSAAVGPEDAPTLALAQAIAAPGPYDPKDLHLRDRQRFSAGGLVDRLAKVEPNVYRLNLATKRIALHALWRNPGAVLRTALGTYLTFWNLHHTWWTLRADRGEDRPLPANLVLAVVGFARESPLAFDLRQGDFWARPSLMKSYHARVALFWNLALLHVPLLLLAAAALAPRRLRRGIAFLALAASIHVVSLCFVATAATPRYMHPMCWLLWPAVAVLWARIRSLRSEAGRKGPELLPAG